MSFKFGTVGAPISTPKKPGGSVGAIQQLASLELECLELGWVQSVRVSESACQQIKQTAEEHVISISVHAPYFINLNATPEEWPNSRKRLMDAAKFGYLAGATDIIFHPGSYFNQPIPEVLDRAIHRLSNCAEELSQAGTQVILRPETMGKIALLGSLQDVLQLAREVPGVAPCLDFAHLHARAGDGSINTTGEWLSVLDQYALALGPDSLRHLHIHMSGIEYSVKGERNHLPITESDFDLHALFKALHLRGCAGRILCESPKMEDDALLMKQTWEEKPA